MPLFAVKTTASQEKTSARMIADRGMDGISAAIAPEQMVAYIIVEAEKLGDIERAIKQVPHARKVIEEETTMSDVEQFLEPTSDVQGVSEGDVVRLTDGPFQGENAKVSSIDGSKEQVTVELYEATVPIPVKVRGDQLRVLDSEEREQIE